MAQKIRTGQIFLWTVVILIQMSVVKCLEVRAEMDPGEEVTVRFDVNRSPEECTEPEETYVNEAGRIYELDRWSAVPASVSERTRQVKKEVEYDQVEAAEQLPAQMEVRAKDGEYGQTAVAVCGMEENEVLREEWQDGFRFLVTFHTYEAGYYQLADRLIPYNDERPELDGCEELLLELAGLESGQYRITEIRWEGEPYEDADGSLCRDALASGQKLVRDYRVRYAGTARFPAWSGWQTVAVYRTPKPEETAETESSGQEVRILPPKEPPEPEAEQAAPRRSVWERITRTLMITVALGAALFFGGLFLLGAVWLVKRLRSCYNRRKINRDGEKNHVYRK